MKLHIDFETRSAADLRRVGVYRYAEDPTTSVLCLSYRFDDGPVQRWRPGQMLPGELLDHTLDSLPVVAHNAVFERQMWNVVLPRQVGLRTPLQIAQQDCTMSRAQALGLPAGLDALGAALNAPIQKDREGHRLMMKLCRPRKVHDDGSIEWWDDPADLERLQAYCDQDVLAECAIDKLLPPLSAFERRVWELDQKINDRGVQVDVRLAARALGVVEEAKRRADREMWRLTNGAVKKCTETAKIVDWINSRGVPCTSVAKGEIEELVLTAQGQRDETCEKVVRLRRAAARSSTAKFKAIIDTACADGRVRGALAYFAAHTSRWGGRLIQPQNFVRIKNLEDVARTLALLESDRPPSEIVDVLDLLTGAPMDTLSQCLRAMIIAAPGHKLVGGDFSNIEGVLNAWQSGETWKVEAYRAYFAGQGPDNYKVTASGILGKPIEEITDDERQSHGKVPELAGGYQGSVGAFVTMAATYLVKPAEIAAVALKNASAHEAAMVRSSYDPKTSHDLDIDVWTGVKLVVNGWRANNPAIVQGWWDLQDAAIEAVEAPGCVVPVFGGKVRYRCSGGFLWCCTASGGVVAYPSPRMRWTESPNGGKRRQLFYQGVDRLTKKWGSQQIYGGSQCDHTIQREARDLLVEAMFRVEDDWPLVLTVHDELLSEVPDDDAHAVAEYRALMEELPPWAEGLPMKVKAWEDKRYVK